MIRALQILTCLLLVLGLALNANAQGGPGGGGPGGGGPGGVIKHAIAIRVPLPRADGGVAAGATAAIEGD